MFRQVREEAAACMAVLTGALCQPLLAARSAPREGGVPGGSLAPAAPPALAAAVESLMQRMVAAAEDDAALLIAQGNTHRRNTENTSETADAPAGGAERDGGEGELGSLGSSSSGSLAGEDAAVRQATCRFETTMMWMVALVKSGDAPYMLPTITRLLGPLLRVQEVADRDLATLAKRTLAYMKYLPMPPRLCPNMAATLQAGCADPLWHTRVATLNFLQVTFRHKQGTFRHKQGTFRHEQETFRHLDPLLHTRVATLNFLQVTFRHKQGTSRHKQGIFRHEQETFRHLDPLWHTRVATLNFLQAGFRHEQETFRHKRTGNIQTQTGNIQTQTGNIQTSRAPLAHARGHPQLPAGNPYCTSLTEHIQKKTILGRAGGQWRKTPRRPGPLRPLHIHIFSTQIPNISRKQNT
jgi:hypothetical protein